MRRHGLPIAWGATAPLLEAADTPELAEYIERLEALEWLVNELRGRVAALERSAQPGPLAQRNAEEHARGERLRETIRQLLEQHPGPRRGAAKRIYPYLLETDIGRTEQPSVRA
ncbi:MAG: hypothetical protein ACRDGS_04505, partial [Chloroflexota bacterium]